MVAIQAVLIEPAPTLTTQGVLIATPRAVFNYMDTLAPTSDTWKLLLRFLLAKNPYESYQPSVEQVARDLDRWLAHQPAPSKRAKQGR